MEREAGQVQDAVVGGDRTVRVADAFCLHPLPEAGTAVAALRGLSLAVQAGERVVVHGPNGSGKTTLLRVLAGEQRLAAGTARVAGLNVSTASARELARWRVTRLGRIDQESRRTLRPELDVLGNVALQLRLAGVARREASARALGVLERLGLGHLADREAATLSGGEAQRVAVCAALAHGPAVVLADEPTGELDAEATAAVYDVLAAAVAEAEATLVLVTHDRRAARIADRVVRIRDGRISETWWPADGSSDRAAEALVVDDRGWLRLPEPLRHGLGDQVRAERDGAALVLRGVPDPASPAPPRERTVDALPAPPTSAIESNSEVAQLRGVRKAYEGRLVLRDVDLAVAAGELLVVTGPSGSGKSTLLRILTGLERPDAGSVLLGGTDLKALDRSGLAGLRAQYSSVVAQDVFLAGTHDAAGSLDLARSVRGLPSDAAQDLRWLAALGLEGLVRRPVRLLSGGERQRVAVARALAVQPRLAILDEPTSQLDEASAERLTAVLREAAAGGLALVVASHDPVLLDAADTVLPLG